MTDYRFKLQESNRRALVLENVAVTKHEFKMKNPKS